jgi:hypothetical protein
MNGGQLVRRSAAACFPSPEAFDSVEAKTAVSQAFLRAQTTALDEALNGG